MRVSAPLHLRMFGRVYNTSRCQAFFTAIYLINQPSIPIVGNQDYWLLRAWIRSDSWLWRIKNRAFKELAEAKISDIRADGKLNWKTFVNIPTGNEPDKDGSEPIASTWHNPQNLNWDKNKVSSCVEINIWVECFFKKYSPSKMCL